MRARAVVLTAVCLLALVGCGDGPGPNPSEGIAEVVVYPADPTLNGVMLVGAERRLAVELRDSIGQLLPPRPVRWTSSEPTIASVSSAGSVTGVAPGQATIRATIGDQSGDFLIGIIPLAASIELVPGRLGLVPGGIYEVFVVYRDENGGDLNFFNRPITWGGADPTVATTAGGNEKAVIQGVGPGSTSFTVSTPSAEHRLTVDVATVRFGDISAGFRHSCGITAAGVAYCWGANVYRILAAPVGGWSTLPFRIEGVGPVAQIVTSGAHACARTTAGESWCWGSQDYGMLGNGKGDPAEPVAAAPQLTLGGHHFTDLTVGEGHTCGVAAGHGYCWGAGGDGQLGNGGTALVTEIPTAVSGNLTLISIRSASLSRTTCGLASNGQAWCWGLNDDGQVGDGTAERRLVPVPVLGGLVFSAITVGDRHTCAVTAGGAAYCWGANESGQLGQTGTHLEPGPVTGGIAFASISAGTAATCGLDTSGLAWCWGANGSGQLGDGTTTASSVPVAVSGGLHFSKLAVGNVHACGLTDEQVAYCWGDPEAVGAPLVGPEVLTPTEVGGQR